MRFSLQSGDVNDAKNLERRIQQKFSSLLGQWCTLNAISRISLCDSEMEFQVEGMSQLCTLHYNIYIPTNLQTTALESATEVKEILKPKRIIELDSLIKHNDYHKTFVSGKPLTDGPLQLEDCTKQFKYLKSEHSKRVTLGDRMTGNENKFVNYVSSFGNYRGGHIYYGVDDDGIVRGQFVEDRQDIVKKVRKAINSVIWLSDNGQFTPMQGEHWDIFFEQVHDEKGRTVKKTIVIVVYISYCGGGVFVRKPESYRIVDGQVATIPFEDWKRRLLETTSQIHPIARSNFTTTKSQNTYYMIMEKMMDLRNQGEKKIKVFNAYINHVNEEYNTVNVQLSTLSQRATYQFRLGKFKTADKLIEEYDNLHRQCEENMLTPGLIQAWFCTHTALLANILANKEVNPEGRNELVMEAKRLLGIALDYSNHVKVANKFTKAVVDLQQKVYIHLSELYLGLSLSGSLAPSDYVSKDDISSAKNCLSMVAKLESEGHQLSPMRKVQCLLACSALHYRQFHIGITDDDVKKNERQLSLDICDEALQLASSNDFKEMISYCQQLKALVVNSQ